MRLDHKVAIVTGAAKGIGEAIAARFLEAGASVAAFDIDGPSVDATAIRLGAHGRVLGITGDVASEPDVADAVRRTAAELGRIDVLVNNAGIEIAGRIPDYASADWDRQLGVNLKGAFLFAKHVIPRMAGSGGAIVNISSVHAFVSYPGNAAYDASKAGLLALTRTLALEHGPDGIRVNAICPGYIETPMTDEWLATVDDPEATMRRGIGVSSAGTDWQTERRGGRRAVPRLRRGGFHFRRLPCCGRRHDDCGSLGFSGRVSCTSPESNVSNSAPHRQTPPIATVPSIPRLFVLRSTMERTASVKPTPLRTRSRLYWTRQARTSGARVSVTSCSGKTRWTSSACGTKCMKVLSITAGGALGIMLLSALDIALHDLRGKLLGLPSYRLLGGAARDSITPYATLFQSMPQGRSWQEMRECSLALMHRAVEAGFRAMKMEMLFYDLVDDRELVRFIHECRTIAGDGRDFHDRRRLPLEELERRPLGAAAD